MDIHKLLAEKREVFGRKVKTLRRQGVLPANLYGKKIKSQSIQLKLSDFLTVYKEAGETGVINLTIKNGKSNETSALISNVQKDTVSDFLVHVDFRQVDLKEKIIASVPVEFIGEAFCEKTGIGTVVQYIDDVEVEALPTDLPEKFDIDISNLAEVDQAIYLKDIKVDKAKISIKDDLEKIIAKVEPPQKEEVAPAPKEEVVEGEQAAEVPEEGAAEEAPAEESKETISEA